MFSGINISNATIQNAIIAWLSTFVLAIIGIPFALAVVAMILREFKGWLKGAIANGGAWESGWGMGGNGGVSGYSREQVMVSDAGDVTILPDDPALGPSKTPAEMREAFRPKRGYSQEYVYKNSDGELETVSSPLFSNRWRKGPLSNKANKVAANDD